MAQFRAKKLDLSCYTNIRIIRDHTKRYVFPTLCDPSSLTSAQESF